MVVCITLDVRVDLFLLTEILSVINQTLQWLFIVILLVHSSLLLHLVLVLLVLLLDGVKTKYRTIGHNNAIYFITCFRCGGVCNDDFIVNLLLSLVMKER